MEQVSNNKLSYGIHYPGGLVSLFVDEGYYNDVFAENVDTWPKDNHFYKNC